MAAPRKCAAQPRTPDTARRMTNHATASVSKLLAAAIAISQIFIRRAGRSGIGNLLGFFRRGGNGGKLRVKGLGGGGKIGLGPPKNLAVNFGGGGELPREIRGGAARITGGQKGLRRQRKQRDRDHCPKFNVQAHHKLTGGFVIVGLREAFEGISLRHLRQRPRELVAARGATATAIDAAQFGDDFRRRQAVHQPRHRLQIATATAGERDVPHFSVANFPINAGRTNSCRRKMVFRSRHYFPFKQLF
jgi:hypothetical protein